jgi:biotin synthase
MIAEAMRAKKNGAEFFGIVASGKSVKTQKEWTSIFKTIAGINKMGIKPCVSLGMIDANQAGELKAAGLFRYYKNLKNAGSYFKNICTTYDCEDDLATIRTAKAAGLSVCTGVLFGLGEGVTHRINLAAKMRALNVDSIPINIFNPIKEKAHDHLRPLSPMEILMTIAVFRFMLPDKDIKLCSSKEENLRQLLPLGIIAGANSLMTGNYLTTAGRDSKLDHEMISDLGLMPTRELDRCKCGREGKHGCSAALTAKRK